MRNLQINTDLRYDYDLSRWRYEDNFTTIQRGGYNQTSIILYTDYGNLSADYDIRENFIIDDTKLNRVKLLKILIINGNYYSDLKHYYFSELVDQLISDCDNEAENIAYYLKKHNIDYKSNYITIISRGYSQGDYCEIIVNVSDYEKVTGAKFDENYYKKYFDNLLCDAPVTGEIEINFDYTANCVNYNYNRVFDFMEWCNDEYAPSIDTDAIIRSIEKTVIFPLTDADKNEIIAGLKNIDYTDVKYPCAC